MSDPRALLSIRRRALFLPPLGFAIALVAVGIGCAGGFGSADGSYGAAGALPGDAGDLGVDSDAVYFAPQDGDAGSLSTIVGSPLCNVSHFPACLPDDDWNASFCTPPHPPYDGGLDAGDAAAVACHVRAIASDGGTLIGPQCRLAGKSSDGQGCLTSEDCAGGFECVGSPGVCRHYCCAGKCGPVDEFCDIETDVDNLKVPVCALIKPCKVLGGSTECAEGETCSIVTDMGATSCVTAGPAKVDQACEVSNCGVNLTCLGQLGARKCFALCDAAHPCRVSGQTCLSSPPVLFRQMGLGVCQ